jgi:Fe-S cluster biogenesis protein NfuA
MRDSEPRLAYFTAEIETLVTQESAKGGEHEPRISFAGVDVGGVVQVRVEGCGTCCPASAVPWIEAIERVLKQRVPGVRFVEVVP